MMDREKVINGLEWILNDIEENGRCHVNYYAGEIRNVLALLKEQETTLEKDGHHIRCLNCGKYWCDNDREGNPFPMNFCPNCGRKAKLDG